MSKPAPKQSFMQTLLFMAVIFLGFNLVMGGLRPPQETRSASEILGKMVSMNRNVQDISIAAEVAAYDRAVDQEASQGKISKKEAEWLKLKAAVLVADTKLKGAIIKNSTNRANMAYMALQGKERSLKNSEVWNRLVTVAPTEARPQTQVSARSLFADIVRDYDSRLKKDLVVGLIPGYQFIDALVAVTGRMPGFSYAFAALLLALVVRSVVWPLAQKQLMWSRQMSQLQPLVKELQESYAKKDPTGAYRSSPEFQQKMMGLYKEYGINPVSGCLPALAQLPLFLLVYQCMLAYRFAFREGTFLWINPSASAATNGFIADSLGQMDYILLVIYGLSMVASTYLAPVSDPANAKQQKLMGVGISLMFTVMMFFWPLPSAFVLYWIFTNLLSMYQSLRAYRMPLPPLVKVNAPHGAVLPTNGAASAAMLKGTGTPRIQKPKKKR